MKKSKKVKENSSGSGEKERKSKKKTRKGRMLRGFLPFQAKTGIFPHH